MTRPLMRSPVSAARNGPRHPKGLGQAYTHCPSEMTRGSVATTYILGAPPLITSPPAVLTPSPWRPPHGGPCAVLRTVPVLSVLPASGLDLTVSSAALLTPLPATPPSDPVVGP